MSRVVDTQEVMDEFMRRMRALCEALDDVVIAHAKAAPEGLDSAIVLGAVTRILAGAIMSTEEPADALMRVQMQLFSEIKREMHDPKTCPVCLLGAEAAATEH
jgi:pyruvate-formate lyase